MTVATSSALTAANLNAKLVSRTDDTVVTGKPNFTNGAQVSTETNGTTAISRTMDGVELIALGMNTSNKYCPAIKGMSNDPQFTTENPKLGTLLVPRATESYTADTDGGMCWDLFITPNDPGATNLPVYAASVMYVGSQLSVYSEGSISLKDGITAPSTVSGITTIFTDTTDGDLKVKFGDGVTKLIARDVAAGGVIQVVNDQTAAVATGTSVIPYDDTIPRYDEGDQYLLAIITPTSATSKLKITVSIAGSVSSGSTITASLVQDLIVNCLAARSVTSTAVDTIQEINFVYYMTAGTTSLTSFVVRAGGTAGTFTLNGVSGARKLGGILYSSITVEEIAG